MGEDKFKIMFNLELTEVPKGMLTAPGEKEVMHNSVIFKNVVVGSLVRAHPRGNKIMLQRCSVIENKLNKSIKDKIDSVIFTESEYKFIKKAFNDDAGFTNNRPNQIIIEEVDKALNTAENITALEVVK